VQVNITVSKSTLGMLASENPSSIGGLSKRGSSKMMGGSWPLVLAVYKM